MALLFCCGGAGAARVAYNRPSLSCFTTDEEDEAGAVEAKEADRDSVVEVLPDETSFFCSLFNEDDCVCVGSEERVHDETQFKRESNVDGLDNGAEMDSFCVVTSG